MAIPNLNPASTSNSNILPVTGNADNVGATLPFGIYAHSAAFLSGAADQVAFTYKKLGGDVLDIELAEGNVYAAYEEASLEYSYLVNLHQTLLVRCWEPPQGRLIKMDSLYLEVR